jgi:hypothetical protein
VYIVTLLTDVVVHCHIHFFNELQGEFVRRGEGVARLSLPPSIFPLTTAKDWAAHLRHDSEGGRERPVATLTAEIEDG